MEVSELRCERIDWSFAVTETGDEDLPDVLEFSDVSDELGRSKGCDESFGGLVRPVLAPFAASPVVACALVFPTKRFSPVRCCISWRACSVRLSRPVVAPALGGGGRTRGWFVARPYST